MFRIGDSVFYHSATKLLLSVYVDDFKLAGPEKELAPMWKRIQKVLDIGTPEPFNQFLGCQYRRFTAKISQTDLPGATEETPKVVVDVVGIEYDE